MFKYTYLSEYENILIIGEKFFIYTNKNNNTTDDLSEMHQYMKSCYNTILLDFLKKMKKSKSYLLSKSENIYTKLYLYLISECIDGSNDFLYYYIENINFEFNNNLIIRLLLVKGYANQLKKIFKKLNNNIKEHNKDNLLCLAINNEKNEIVKYFIENYDLVDIKHLKLAIEKKSIENIKLLIKFISLDDNYLSIMNNIKNSNSDIYNILNIYWNNNKP
jgi:hypothetical protein